MKKLFLSLVILWGGISMAEYNTLDFNFDKGGVDIQYEELSQPYELSFTLPSECSESKIKISDESHSISVHHEGEQCNSGAHFLLKINQSFDALVSIDAGAITVRNINRTLERLATLRASVEAGALSTSTTELEAKRTSSYAGSYVDFSNIKNPNGHNLKLKVKAGAMSL